MHTRILPLLAFAALIGASRAGAAEPPETPAPATLQETIRALLAGERFDLARTGVYVLADDGTVQAAISADTPRAPASNLKILTTAAALHFLGEKYEFETTLTATARVKDGVIPGDLIVRGGGDPNISGRFYHDDPEAVLRSWAKTMHAAGIRAITGDLLADDTFFDDVRFPPTWNRAEEFEWFAAQVSALSLNDNCLDLTVTPGKAGAPARVTAAPESDFFRLAGAPKSVAKGNTKIILERKTDTNRIAVTGRINVRAAAWKGWVTIDDPALFFVNTFARILREEGLRIDGAVRKVSRSAPAAPAPDSQLLLRHVSPLSRALPVINKNSQNLHAELLLRTVGAVRYGEGSAAAGARAIGAFLDEIKAPREGLVIDDGSGLSATNRVTPRTFGQALHAMRARENFTSFFDSLSVAGIDGTLKGPERFGVYPELKGSVFGKTGMIARASALSGYVRNGARMWTFSLLFNHLPKGSAHAHRMQERIVRAIYLAMAPPVPPPTPGPSPAPPSLPAPVPAPPQRS